MPSLDPPPFVVQLRPDRSRGRLLLNGELDIASAAEVQTAGEGLCDAGWKDVVADVRAVTSIDSNGLAPLVAADERARREGWRFAITTDCAPLERPLELTCRSTTLQRA